MKIRKRCATIRHGNFLFAQSLSGWHQTNVFQFVEECLSPNVQMSTHLKTPGESLFVSRGKPLDTLSPPPPSKKRNIYL